MMNGDGDKSSDSQFISFQDYSPINRSAGGGQAQLDIDTPDNQGFVGIQNDSTGIGMIEDLQGMPNKNDQELQHNFWSIEYYQKFFNVDTDDVVQRIIRSIIPRGGENYLESHIRPKPDLYGPFWVCVTLIFAIAISGNMANYLQTANSQGFHWRYDFHIVSYAATAIFMYAWLLPLALWGALKWSTSKREDDNELIESNTAPGILELLCLYGYSLSIYIPVAFLWTIQIGWLQWTLVAIAAFMSGGVLLRSLSPVIAGKHKAIYAIAILGMHFLLAAGFKMYFFHNPRSTPSASQIIEVVTTVASVVKAVNNSSSPT
ncbi:protein YIPF1 [Neodiprion pinetum]|uniref:protein YIPF1 n=1 Tax=Neodiprion pinetum TaxID=441929 RepID=UPI001EE0DBD9|nr:protein YIPF1 [Neodiprion pinetum]